jgi:hypothetical protein
MINIRNNKGIALITSLMFTLISLTIVMALFYVITQSVQVSAQNKRYRTSLDASYGGSEIMVKDILPVIMQNYSSTSLVSNTVTAFSGVGLQFLVDQSCFQKKLTNETANWPSGCSSAADPKKSPDLSIVLQSSTGNPFIVYSKIVDTIPGNSDTSGLQLEGGGVAETSSLLTPISIPYIYRMEVQAERQTGSTAQANIQILYAY